MVPSYDGLQVSHVADSAYHSNFRLETSRSVAPEVSAMADKFPQVAASINRNRLEKLLRALLLLFLVSAILLFGSIQWDIAIRRNGEVVRDWTRGRSLPSWYADMRCLYFTWMIAASCMAGAVWLAIAQVPLKQARWLTLLAFSQLVASLALFGMLRHAPASEGMFLIAMFLLGASLLVVRQSGRVRAAAGRLQIPFVAWACYASLVTYSVWKWSN